MVKLSTAAKLKLGPYPTPVILRRLNQKRIDLGIAVKELDTAIGMDKSTYSLKIAGHRGIKLEEISTLIAVFQMLRPGWKCPPGFPFIPEHWALRITETLDNQPDITPKK